MPSGLLSRSSASQDERMHLWYRPSPTPIIALPCGARSAGHYRFQVPWAERMQGRNFLQIFWGIAGQGFFQHQGQTWTLKQDEIFIYPHGAPHQIHCTEPWEYRWWTMDGPLADSMVTAFGLSPGLVLPAGPCPSGRLDALAALIVEPDPAAERLATALLVELLGLAASRPTKTDESDQAEQCRRRLEAAVTDTDCSIAGIAELLGIHRSTLSRRFQTRFGRSPQDYLAALRLRLALDLLTTTTLTVATVAQRCGFTDANYFSRLISQATGRSPMMLRKR